MVLSKTIPAMRTRLLHLTAVAALWAASGADAQPRSIHADCGSVAFGGSGIGNTVKIRKVFCGIPPEQFEALVQERTKDKTRDLEDLSATQRDLIKHLKADLELNQGQIRTALDIVGEANVPPERLAIKLIEIAERFKALQTTAAAQPGDDPKVTALKAEAQKAINAGDLAKADELLAEVEQGQTAALNRLALNAAETSAQRGQVALTRLRYLEAAQHFATAASRVPSEQEDKRRAYLEQEASTLYQQGDEFGDNRAASMAIERYRQILVLRPRGRVPLDWAATQMDLGIALTALGTRESGTEKLEQAIEAFRLALLELTRERAPLDWARTQSNLGAVLWNVGIREDSAEKLEEAIEAFRSALLEFTRERTPLNWAMILNNVGIALWNVGARESGTEKLEQAIQAFRSALLEFTRERTPLDWAKAQFNLGIALTTLGTRESGTEKLEQAIEAFRSALLEFTRERTPLNWAMTQSALGIALTTLGARESGTEKLEQAIQAFRLALQENTRERSQLTWAPTQAGLDNALKLLEQRAEKRATLPRP